MSASGVSWPLVVMLGCLALVRPALSIAGLADDWGRPGTPLVATAAITALWVAVVVGTRQRRPVLTLVLAGLAYAGLVTALSAALSPVLDGELSGPVTNPFALVGVAAVNAAWGAVAGLLALALLRRPDRGRGGRAPR